MDKRAVTNEQKREIIERLYALWITPEETEQRLGQLIFNYVIRGTSTPFFYIEDYDFMERLNRDILSQVEKE